MSLVFFSNIISIALLFREFKDFNKGSPEDSQRVEAQSILTRLDMPGLEKFISSLKGEEVS